MPWESETPAEGEFSGGSIDKAAGRMSDISVPRESGRTPASVCPDGTRRHLARLADLLRWVIA